VIAAASRFADDPFSEVRLRARARAPRPPFERPKGYVEDGVRGQHFDSTTGVSGMPRGSTVLENYLKPSDADR
jgi:hypothetical protein